MMTNMSLMTVAECVADSPTPRPEPVVRVEELARGRRVRVADTHGSWVIVLPTDGFEFQSMQYQISADDAARSAVLELKMEGDAYRQALAGINSDSTTQSVLASLRVLLQPVLPLFGLLDNQVAQGGQPVPLRSVKG